MKYPLVKTPYKRDKQGKYSQKWILNRMMKRLAQKGVIFQSVFVVVFPYRFSVSFYSELKVVFRWRTYRRISDRSFGENGIWEKFYGKHSLWKRGVWFSCFGVFCYQNLSVRRNVSVWPSLEYCGHPWLLWYVDIQWRHHDRSDALFGPLCSGSSRIYLCL